MESLAVIMPLVITFYILAESFIRKAEHLGVRRRHSIANKSLETVLSKRCSPDGAKSNAKPCDVVCKQSVSALDKKKGQPVKVGLDSLGTRIDAGFP